MENQARREAINQVNVLNILDVAPDELGFWLSTVILDEEIMLPQINANAQPNIQAQIAPLLPIIANRQTLVSSLLTIVIGSTPTQTSVRSSGDMAPTIKGNKEVLGRKKEMLGQAFDQLKSNYACASRLISCFTPTRGGGNDF